MTNTNTLNKRPPSTPTERKLLLILWVCHYGETVGKVQVQILPLIRHLIYIYVYKSAYIDFGMIKWFPRWPKNCPAVTVVPPLESDPSLWPSLAAGELLPPSPEYFRQAFFMDRELFYSYFASAASTTAKMRKKKMTIESLFLPNSFGLHFLLMRDLQHLNDTGRRLLSSAAAVPQEDSGYTSAAASTFPTNQTSDERICPSKHPPGCLLAAWVGDCYGWPDWLMAYLRCSSVILIGWIPSPCCAAINSNSNRPDASLSSLSTLHPLWRTFLLFLFFFFNLHMGKVQTISCLPDLHPRVSLPG